MDQGPYPQQPGGPPGPPPPPSGPPGVPPPGPPGVPPSGAPAGGGLPGWLLPAAIGVIVVAVAGIAWLLVIDGDDDDGDSGLTASGLDDSDGDDPEGPEDANGGDDGDDDGPDDGLTFDPARLTGTWEGSYECASGAAEVALTLDDFPGEEGIGAGWKVSPADGSDTAEGIFYLEGTHADDQLSLEAFEPTEEYEVIDADEWLGLEADLAGRDDTEVIEATVVGEGCGDVTLERTGTDPWYVGTWSGTYDCAQGASGGTLSVEATAPDQVRGIFEFYDIGGTHDDFDEVPYGAFYVTGTYIDRQLFIDPAGWADGLQPPNYSPVPLVTYEPAPIDPDAFIGGLSDEFSCSIFGFGRVSDDPYADSEEAEAAATAEGKSRPEELP